MNGSLTCRIGSSNHEDIFTLTGESIYHRSAIVYTSSSQFLHSLYPIQIPIRYSAGNNQSMAAYLRSILYFDYSIRISDAYTFSFLRSQNFSTEPNCLSNSSSGKVTASQARRKAKVVFD